MIAILLRVFVYFFLLAALIFVGFIVLSKWIIPPLAARSRISAKKYKQWEDWWSKIGGKKKNGRSTK